MDAVLDVIGGKWKILILWHLARSSHRYGELRRAIPRITEKMLAQQLRQLESDGLIHRESYPEVPPRVVYSLTDCGETLTPHLDGLADWGRAHFPDRIAESPTS